MTYYETNGINKDKIRYKKNYKNQNKNYRDKNNSFVSFHLFEKRK